MSSHMNSFEQKKEEFEHENKKNPVHPDHKLIKAEKAVQHSGYKHFKQKEE